MRYLQGNFRWFVYLQTLTPASIYLLLSADLSSFLVSTVQYKEDYWSQKTNRSKHEVAEGNEWVVASQKVGRRELEVLVSREWAHIVVVCDVELIVAFGKVLCDHTKQLLEGWQACSPHPHNKVLVFHIRPLEGLPVGKGKVLEIVLYVSIPSNVMFIHMDRIWKPSTSPRIDLIKRQGIIEQTLGY